MCVCVHVCCYQRTKNDTKPHHITDIRDFSERRDIRKTAFEWGWESIDLDGVGFMKGMAHAQRENT